MWRASRVAAPIVVAVVVAALGMTGAGSAATSNTSKRAGGASAKVNTSFVYGSEGGITTLNWGAPFQGTPEREIGSEMGGMLYAWDVSKLRGNGCDQLPGVGDVKGDLVQSAKWDPKSSSYIITLRNTKSENGNPLTSADVKFTFDHLIAAKTSVAALLMNTVADYGITLGDTSTDPFQPVNKQTVRLHVVRKTPFDLAILTWPSFRILDSVAVKQHATTSDPYADAWLQNNNPGFGPWKVSGFAPGSAVFLTRNPNYWGPRGNIKKEIIKNIPDGSTRAQLLAAGQLDYAANLSYSDYISLTKKGPSSGVAVQRCFSANRTTLVLNFKDPILGNQMVRQAISMAIDRSALNKAGYLGQFLPARYGVGTQYSFTKSAAVAYPPVNIAKAKALLAAAGYPNGFQMTMLMSLGRPGPEALPLSVLIKSELAQIGIDVTIQQIASTTDFLGAFTAGNYQAMLYLEPPAISDPYYSLNLLNASDSFQDTFQYHNAEYDQLVGQLRFMAPGPARDAVVTKLSSIVVDTVPVVYLTDNIFLHAVRNRFTGWTHSPSGDIYAYLLKAK